MKKENKDLEVRQKLKFLPLDIYNLLFLIEEIAHKTKVNAYLVGGIVRDLLLNKKNSDLDLVVEGNGIFFAEKLVERCGGKIIINKRFKTARVELNNELKVDIVTSRKEFYAYSGALPDVEEAKLYDDLYRRDFTINAMAISLNKENFGELIDYFGGLQDLKNKKVRILHNLSFVDDPTRILRAVKFESRYGFTMEAFTSELCKKHVSKLKNLTKPRLFEEFRKLLKETKALKSILRLKELGALKFILGTNKINEEMFFKLEDLIFTAKKRGLKFEPYLLYFGLLAVENTQIYNEIHLLGLLKKEINLLNKLQNIKMYKSIFQKIEEKAGDIHISLRKLENEVCLFFSLLFCSSLQVKRVVEYLRKRQNLKISLKGDDLLSLGISPGPFYSKIFKELEVAILNEDVHNEKEKIKEWIKKNFKPEANKCF